MIKARAEFLALQQFFGGYFHQDWHCDAETPDEVLKKFASESTVAERRELASLIEKYMAEFNSDAELDDKLFEELGSYYQPSGTGDSSREWLHHIAEILRAG